MLKNKVNKVKCQSDLPSDDDFGENFFKFFLPLAVNHLVSFDRNDLHDGSQIAGISEEENFSINALSYLEAISKRPKIMTFLITHTKHIKVTILTNLSNILKTTWVPLVHIDVKQSRGRL